MTGPEHGGQWPVDSVANDHLRTSDGWIPLARKSRTDGPPWSPGDVVDGHVMTETGTWVSTGEAAHTAPPLQPPMAPSVGMRQRLRQRPLAAKIALGLLAAWAVLIVADQIVEAVRSPGDGDARTESTQPAPQPTTPDRTEAAPKARPTVDPEAKYAAKMQRRGWTELSEGLWARWDSPAAESNIMGVTWKMRVVSPDGCPNGVYVEANVLDSSGTVVGFTNAMLPSLGAHTQALMQLTTTMGTQRISLEPTKGSCN